MTEMEGADRAAVEVDFFKTPSGVRIVDSPTRSRILRLLADGELSFEEIVARTARAKSTVSVHLSDLVADSVLGSRNDPDDGRRKFFFIKAEHLGRLADTERFEADIGRILADFDPANTDPTKLYRVILRSIRVALLRDGVNIDPILHEAGVGLGRVLARAFAGMTTEQLLEALTEFWSRHTLGRVEVAGTAPLELVVYDCAECMYLPYLGRPACALDKGVLTAIFEAHYARAVQIEETACYAMGSGYCRFVIEPVLEPADTA